MSRAAKLLARLNAGSSLTFAELAYLAEALGFSLARQKGSHRIHRNSATGRQFNLIPSGKDAKPDQCDQLRAIIQTESLHLDD